MFEVSLKNIETVGRDIKLRVVFKHERYKPSRLLDLGHDVYLVQARTTCQILTHDAHLGVDVILAEGNAYCSVTDQFSRAEGRKHSFTEATLVERFGGRVIGDSISKLLWEKFFEVYGQPKPRK